jgi:hypothetical protein
MAFDYKTFVTSPEDLEPKLKEHGKDNWRLHTCEPFVILGLGGVGTPHVLVVMDKVFEDRPAPSAPRPDRQPIGAMELKG